MAPVSHGRSSQGVETDMKKTEGILKLYDDGRKPAEIAREMHCTIANVCQTIKRFKQWDGKIKPLPADLHTWLLDTADRNNVSPAALASKLLEQTIEIYRKRPKTSEAEDADT